MVCLIGTSLRRREHIDHRRHAVYRRLQFLSYRVLTSGESYDSLG